MKVWSRGNVFQFALLLVGTLVLVAGCRKEEKIELEAFRLPPQEVVAVEEVATAQIPLFRVESDSPAGLMARIEPLLPVLLPPHWMDQVPGVLEELRRFEALALTLWQTEIVLPETGAGPVVKSLELVLSGRPSGDVNSADVLEDAQRLAGFLGAVIPGEETTECRIEGEEFECSIVVGDVVSSLAMVSNLPHPDGSLLRLSVGPAAALRMLERTFGAPAVWSVVPEEVGHWDRLELTLPADLDRIELSLETSDSVAVPILKQMFSKRGTTVEVPKDSAVIVLASFQNMDNLVSQLDESFGKKLGPGAMVRARKLLASSWHTELLEVAEGYCGAIPGKKISLSDPLSSFVYFMEPKTDEYLQKRLNYIFAKKNYRIEDREFRTGEKVWVAVRRGARKNRERMAWFKRGEAVFLGSTTNLQSVAESLFVPEWKKPDPLKLSLPEGEWLHAWIHVDGLAERLDLGELGGMGAGMALAVLKTIAEEVPLPVELSFLQERLAGGSDRLVVRVDNLFALGLAAAKQLAPFLNLMNRRRDEQSKEGSSVPPTIAGNQ